MTFDLGGMPRQHTARVWLCGCCVCMISACIVQCLVRLCASKRVFLRMSVYIRAHAFPCALLCER